MLIEAILLSSSGSHSVRDRSRVHPAGRLGRSLAFWHRRTTAGSTAADPRSRPMRVPECKRRRQHSCMGHAGRAEEVWLPLVAFPLSPSRFGPRRSAPGTGSLNSRSRKRRRSPYFSFRSSAGCVPVGQGQHSVQMHRFCRNAFRGPEAQIAASAALSRRKGPLRTARG